MATESVNQDGPSFVSFVTSADEGCIPSGHGDVPGMVVHPDAGAVNLWGIAESRLTALEKMLAMFAEGAGAGFDMTDFTDVVRPRVQEILTLAATGNTRASLNRFADGLLQNAMK
jgi:hypothetical protein